MFTAKHFLDFIGTIPVMIMEFVNGGCLRGYLNGIDRVTLSMDPTRYLKIKENFLLYGKQIADGMGYLVRKEGTRNYDNTIYNIMKDTINSVC